MGMDTEERPERGRKQRGAEIKSEKKIKEANGFFFFDLSQDILKASYT